MAQQANLSRTLSVSFSNIPLEEVLKQITDVSGLEFSYSPSLIPMKNPVNYRARNAPIQQILSDILSPLGIEYMMVNGYLVLRQSASVNTPDPGKHLTFTLSGVITDSSNRELVIGAAVYLKESGRGVTSNNYGFYSLTLPAGTYSFQTSCIGYGERVKTINLNSDMIWNIQLNPLPYNLKEIIIQSNQQEQQVFSSLAAQISMNPLDVQHRSAALGETDILKSLENLPGVCFQSDGSSFFFVRGGAKDQNLILLDEAPIYNPSHMLGLFTPIIPEAIKQATVYRADFPVEFGGRLSSVIDIRARDGNMRKFSGSASISPVSTRFSVEGPLKKEASSYFVSFRVSTFGRLVKAANPAVESFYFADFTSKFNVKLGKRDRIYLTLFAGKDAFFSRPEAVRSGLEWSNNAATLRWSHVYGSRMFSNTTLFVSQYNYNLYTDYDQKDYWNSNITGSNLKSEYSWYLHPKNHLKFGFQISGFHFNPGNYQSKTSQPDTMRVSEVNSAEALLYAGDEIQVGRWLKANISLRYSIWNNFGEAFSIGYNESRQPETYHEYAKGENYYSHKTFEPRISISLKTGPSSSIKASYNRTLQHIHQINNSISPLNAMEVWLPSGPNLRPQKADIFNLGWVTFWQKLSIDFTADVFYKKMYNQIGYSYHAEMLLNPYLEGELKQGRGKAYGFEVMVRKTRGKLTGQIGYARSRSYLLIPTLNGDRWYRAHQDKPHDFSFMLDAQVRPRWTLHLNALITSGITISSPSGFYNYQGYQVPYYTRQNNDRLPLYKRVDIGSEWRLNKREKHFRHFFSVTVYNLMNTHNYCFLNFSKTQGEDGKFYIPADKLNPSPQIPTYRYIYSVIPSFTYYLMF
jgi:hypothetical protein